MKRRIAYFAIIVNDYDEAINFYTQKLKFKLIEDKKLSKTKRWVLISPESRGNCYMLLARASNTKQKNRIGDQTGGRVFIFLHTDNFNRDYKNLVEQKIKIIRKPADEAYGKVAVFEDLYGNLWDLVEPHIK